VELTNHVPGVCVGIDTGGKFTDIVISIPGLVCPQPGASAIYVALQISENGGVGQAD
jgi:hypothetical protein